MILLAVLLCATLPLYAIGLYEDLPSHFSVIDTTRFIFVFRQTELQRDEGRAAVLAGEFNLRLRKRIDFQLILSYPALERERDIIHGVGDAMIRSTVRVAGDTLGLSGLFLRANIRAPMGSRALKPFSFGSLDGGVGLECRQKTPLFQFRLATTYTLVGERSETGSFLHEHFLLLSPSLEVNVRKGTSFAFTMFYLVFRGGGAREVYSISLTQAISQELGIILNGALEAGKDEERVFNSLLSLALTYKLPSRSDSSVDK